MFHTSTHTRPSAAEGMRAYGLSGIELGHRADERHDAAARRSQLREVEVRGRVNNIRQWLGDAMVRAGTGLAGDAATLARRPAMRPKATMS
jgi:hypothetical protein